MNSSDINLLATSPVSHDKEKKLKQVRLIAAAFIVLVGLMSILTFVLNISSPLDSVKKQENDILSQITSQENKAAKLAIVDERALAISKIYSQRQDFGSIVSLVLSKKTDDIKTTALNIDQSSVIVTISSASLLSLNNFLNSVINVLKNNNQVSSVFLDSLSVNQTSSSYVMGIRINLKNE